MGSVEICLAQRQSALHLTCFETFALETVEKHCGHTGFKLKPFKFSEHLLVFT